MIMVGTITSSMAYLRKVPPRLIPTMPYEHKLVYNISVSSSHHQKNGIGRFRIYTSMSSSSAVSTEQIEPQWKPESQPQQEMEVQSQEGKKFDWYAQWYPVMPVCDLDKRVPHGKTVMGIEVVVWWDRNEAQWKVFDDRCPHRLAPLSEGRIDQWGRLQCVYHGWCFSGSGHCKFIPQAPPDGPPVNTTTKACVAVYPSTVRNGIIWFWPNSEPQYGDILQKKQPPYISEIDDPSFTTIVGNRDIFYGYEVLIENLMDPAHIPYAHYGLMQTIKPKVKRDREGGRPLDMSIRKLDLNGFIAKQEWGSSKFIPPCIFYAYPNPPDTHEDNGTLSSAGDASKVREESTAGIPQRKALLIFICVPVSPGKSRLIWAFPRNFAVWIDRVLPRWFFHIRQNLVLDSDLYLLHVQERKIAELGPANWQRACYVPTKSDALVVGFRRWIIKYSGGKVDWGNKFSGALPPTPPREQLMDRYWTHVVNCSSCSSAVKGLNALEVSLQIVSVAALGVVAATKQNAISAVARTSLVGFAVVCFAASRWLSHFVYKTFYYHDYHHALK